MKRKVILQVEELEPRWVPSTTTYTSPTYSSTSMTDTTTSPSTTTTTYNVTVTALGTDTNGYITRLTVTGLDSSAVQAFQSGTPMGIIINNVGYQITQLTALPTGQYQITVGSGIPDTQVYVGQTDQVVEGSSSYPASSTTTTSTNSGPTDTTTYPSSP